MPWTQGEFNVPNNFVAQYNAGQKKIRADLMDENFTDVADAINKVATDYAAADAAMNTTFTQSIAGATELANTAVETAETAVETAETAVETARSIKPYELCEIYTFRNPMLRPGFVTAYGSVISAADTTYPAAWEYLLSAEGQMLCKTEAEWQAMSTADPWNGIGGVPFFVIDAGAKTIRVPDIRGMYVEAAGFDSLGVGSVHGDMIRNITGASNSAYWCGSSDAWSGAFSGTPYRAGSNISAGSDYMRSRIDFDVSRVVPTGNANKPRAFGVLPCVFLGD